MMALTMQSILCHSQCGRQHFEKWGKDMQFGSINLIYSNMLFKHGKYIHLVMMQLLYCGVVPHLLSLLQRAQIDVLPCKLPTSLQDFPVKVLLNFYTLFKQIQNFSFMYTKCTRRLILQYAERIPAVILLSLLIAIWPQGSMAQILRQQYICELLI